MNNTFNAPVGKFNIGNSRGHAYDFLLNMRGCVKGGRVWGKLWVPINRRSRIQSLVLWRPQQTLRIRVF